jgi:tetratricopeptide (TPR) repeat protein
MVHAAHASHYHWLHAGDEVNEQRGEWLIARAYQALGHKEAALRHAERCVELTEQYGERMEDFDLAFAYEGLARANALAGNIERARELKAKAFEFGQRIAAEEDREVFEGDLAGGEWYGI